MQTTSRMLFYPAIEEYISYDEILITQRRYLSDIDIMVTSLGSSSTYYFCRRMPFPYNRYGALHTGVIFDWSKLDYLRNDSRYWIEVFPPMIESDTEIPKICVALTTSYNTRTMVARGELMLYTFQPYAISTGVVGYENNDTLHDSVYNLYWR